jgi:tetratricopeptide (TPR) repeat protein
MSGGKVIFKHVHLSGLIDQRQIRNVPKPLSLVLIFFLLSLNAFGQISQGTPEDWILYEKANAMFAQHEYGQALQLYKEAISSAGIFPEAEMGVGDVFFEEGEFELARDQYEKAYEMRKGFKVPETQYGLLYRLADLYQSREMYSQMEDSLLKIEMDDKKFSDSDGSRLIGQIWKNYKGKGIDHTLFLYQFDVPFAQAAHSTLGWFYYRSGLYEKAAQELLFAVIYKSTEMNAALHDMDVDYEFSNLSDLLAAAQSHKEISSFASNGGFFKDLYYLAGASYGAGFPAHAALLWKLLSASKLAGTYTALSARQLKSPFMEKVFGTGRGGNY